MILSLNRDPWRRPYKIVTKKLRSWTSPITELLDHQLLTNMVDTFFSIRETVISLRAGSPNGWTEKLIVFENEMVRAFRRLRGRPKAPNGVHGKV